MTGARLKNAEWDQAVIARYPDEGGHLLAKEFGVHPATVTEWASRLGIKKHRMTRCYDYFDSWSPPMAYDLGYLFADGNVNQAMTSIQLRCCTRDESIILGIRERLQSSNKLVRKRIVEKNGTVTFRTNCSIGSVRLVKSLIERHGLVPNKTCADSPFPYVPEEFLPHFLRGSLDGDGTVSRTIHRGMPVCYLSWLGTHKFIRGLKNRVMSAIPVSETKTHAKRHNLLYVKWGAEGDLQQLCDFLYPPGEYPFLARKRERLESYLTMRRTLRGS